MKNYINGNVRKIIYESSSSPYKVGIFKVRETNIEELNEYIDKIISFTGSFNEINMDLDYTFYGSIVEHPKYGAQFSVETYEIKEPNDNESLIIYLSSGLFKGIGIKTAKKIVEKFGKDTVNIIKNDYKKLSLVHGVNDEKASKMHDKIMDNEINQDYIIRLNALGFSVKEAIDLINLYKSNLFNVINDNIYELVEYISFDKLDNIYLKDNMEDSLIRIEALIKHNIYNICNETGDTLVSKEELLIKMKSNFKTLFSLDKFLLHLNNLIKKNEIIEVKEMIALKSFYDTESLIYNNILRLNNIKNNYDIERINIFISEYEKRNSIELAKNQKEAIIESIVNNFYIITGGPGTGKTTIIKAVVEILEDLEDYASDDIALLAPTGRSAKRMAESVIFPASTIHKYLKWNKETNDFQINENNKSKNKVVIVDEASMIDIFLFTSLLKGLPLNVKLILVGDANQLPSIGPGDVLNNLLSCDNIKKKVLNEIYRVKEGSYITYLANDIKNTKSFDKFENYDDFKFIEASDEEIIPYLIEICKSACRKGIKPDNFQVLAPMYKGYNGIDNLNRVMTDIFNPNKNKVMINDIYYSVGDKVIQLVNDVENNVFNGDIGYIKEIEYAGKKLVVTIDYMGNYVEYTSGEFDKFMLAYAISIHKSQGSEYDNVVVILAKGFSRMFYNKLIYTAVTRAKSSLIIIGSVESLNKSVSTLYATNRKTYLKYINN